MTERFNDLMQQLGQAINDAITGSGEVDAALDQVRASGVDVFLVLEATICVRRRDGEPVDVATEAEDAPAIEMSAEDRQFLKRLRISVEPADE